MDFSRVFVVMPAFNAEYTLERTFWDIPAPIRKNVILVDDASTDRTVEVARNLGIVTLRHSVNVGYGANQKTCYVTALQAGAEIIIMVHPDFQYDARVALIMAEIIDLGTCDMVLGNRIRTRKEALDGGMPKWKYFTNRLSTFAENFVLGQSLGDFHSGLRAYSREFLATVPFAENSDDFSFDQEMLVQAVAFGFRLGDIPVPVRYMEEASSINFRRSMAYGMGGVNAIGAYWLHKGGLREDPRFAYTCKRSNRLKWGGKGGA